MNCRAIDKLVDIDAVPTQLRKLETISNGTFCDHHGDIIGRIARTTKLSQQACYR